MLHMYRKNILCCCFYVPRCISFCNVPLRRFWGHGPLVVEAYQSIWLDHWNMGSFLKAWAFKSLEKELCFKVWSYNSSYQKAWSQTSAWHHGNTSLNYGGRHIQAWDRLPWYNHIHLPADDWQPETCCHHMSEYLIHFRIDSELPITWVPCIYKKFSSPNAQTLMDTIFIWVLDFLCPM